MAQPHNEATLFGLGNLGAAMAARLLARGWNLHVVDADPERVHSLTSQGASADVDLTTSRFVCFATPDVRSIESILDSGVEGQLTSTHVFVVHSTILPNDARRLAGRLQTTSGARYLDAPVSGGAERARNGELTIFVAGQDEAIEEAFPLLADLGTEVLSMGDVGAASSTKLANQLVLFASLAGLHEALALTRSSGVRDVDVLRALESGLGDTWAGRHWGFFDQLSDDYDAAGVNPGDRPWAKDLREVVEAAAGAGISAPVADLLADVVPDLIAQHARSVHLEEEL